MNKYPKTSKYIFIFFLSMLILTIIVFCLYSISTYEKIKKVEIYNYEEDIKNFTSKINSIFLTFDNLSTQIAMLPSVNQLLYETEAKDLVDFIKLKDELEAFDNNNLYYSIYIYFRVSDYVYTTKGGLYSLSDFYDNSFLNELNKDVSTAYMIYPNHQIARPFSISEAHNVFSFIRCISLFCNHYGYVVININQDSLLQLISESIPNNREHLCLMKDDTVLFCSDFTMKTAISKKTCLDSNHIITVDNKKYLTQEFKLNQYGFQIYSLLPLSIINDKFLITLKNSIHFFVSIILVEFLLSCFFIVLMIKPINHVIIKIQDKNKKNDTILRGFDGLDQAVDDLFQYTNNIISKFETNKPVLKESILLNMIWGNTTSLSSLKELNLSQYDIHFTYPYFYTFIAYVEEINQIKNLKIKDQIRIYIQENVDRLFCSLGNIYNIFLENDKVVFIFNTDMDIYTNITQYQKIYDIFSILHRSIKKELNIYVVFSFGTKEIDYTNIYLSFFAANNNLMYASIFNDEFTVFCEKNENNLILKKLPFSQLINDITNKNLTAIKEYIHFINEKCKSENLNISQIKQLFISLVSSIYIQLWEKGININPNDLALNLAKITNIADFNTLQNYITETIQSISLQIGKSDDAQKNKNVTATLDFIHNNYTKDISVVEIADHIGLNHIYLNKIFKLSIGKTISEYLNFYRIEKSKNLLCNTNFSINNISTMLGYNDVRSYIRFFKKFTGVTPGNYRDANTNFT